MAFVKIIEGPLPALDLVDDPLNGSELIFHGRVRGTEHGKSIVALDYEAYLPMAEIELNALAEEAEKRYEISDLKCWHRIGEVSVGQASLRVMIYSAHRAEGIECFNWFMRELKSKVPIWKWALTESGERFASHCQHDCDNSNNQ